MIDLKNILVPFDDNIRSIRALEYAAMFASGIGAKITALHIADPKNYQSKLEFEKELALLVESQLQPKLDQIHKNYTDIRKIELQIKGMEKPVYQHILEFAKEIRADFIVMRSHGLKQADDWELHFKSTNAYKVLLEATCPVFTFTQSPDQPRLKNILVPIDLSEGSLYKVPFAQSLAKRFNSKLHLVSATEYSEDKIELEPLADKIYKELLENGLDVVKTPTSVGTLPDAIFSYCDHYDVDLVIIMSRPGFRWSDLWVSPKAKRIVSWSKVPVLSLRSNEPFKDGYI